MPTNKIKTVGGGLALQVTMPARDARLVEDATEDDEATYLADVKVAGVDDTLLVFDADRTDPADRAELYRVAVRDARSQHEIRDATVQTKGHGYMVLLPGAAAAGFREGDTAPVRAADGLLIITSDTRRALRRGQDLETSWRDAIKE